MSKKAFTMVELLAVVAILGIISSIAYPKIINVIGNSRLTAYNVSKKNIVDSAKLKYLADNDFKDLKDEKLKEAISNKIKSKNSNLVGNMASEGTTPRQLTDLIGSLCDLTSGSGDKGTPIVMVSGYFDNYTNE